MSASSGAAVRWERIEGDVALVTFDQPGSSANVLNDTVLEELDQVIGALEQEQGLKGVVFVSAKPSIFIAGADVKNLVSLAGSDDALRAMIRQGQTVYNRLEALQLVTVAAIHGACLGGGFELCLACDYRVASDDRATKIGLPETSLGILPAWGGCTRLPRLIGLPAACDLILGGKRLAGKPAQRRGLVDYVVPKEAMLMMARRILGGARPVRKGHGLVNNALVARVVARRAGKDVLAKTHGHYPAVTRALEVLTRGITRPMAESLRMEEDAVIELVATPACRNLMGIFFLQERAKHLKPQGQAKPAKVERTAVIGAGVMGAGIVQWLSAQGRTVVMRDLDAERVRAGMATVGKLYRDAVQHHVMEATAARQGFDRVIPAAAEVTLARTDLVIEAAVEAMTVKHKIFKRLGEISGVDTILATNTSALSVSELAGAVAGPERVIGIHFFNPVHRMQLVEVIVGKQTSPAVVDRTVRFVQDSGKLPVVVKDSPGFVVNRILMPYLVEAGNLYEAGAPTLRLDAAMLAFGMPMGPLRLIDEVGVDVAYHVANHLATCFGDRMAVPGILPAMATAKQLGRKTGVGFYVYQGKQDPRPNGGLSGHARTRLAAALTGEDLAERMVLLMVNEAARCLEEGVVAEARDIDFAMIMGTGFAPFRGGPLRHADACGTVNVARRLERLAATVHPRFAPCALLVRMANDGGKTFYGGGASK